MDGQTPRPLPSKSLKRRLFRVVVVLFVLLVAATAALPWLLSTPPALATIVATVTIFAVWANRQIANTDNWTDTTTQLLENENVRDALGTYLVQELFTAAPIEDSLRNALPPQLQPLAGPAAAGLRQVAERNAPRVLSSRLV